MRITCNADDTLVIRRGRTHQEVARRATVGTKMVYRIHQLGLSVALHKTKVLLFHGARRGPPRVAQITINGEPMPVTSEDLTISVGGCLLVFCAHRTGSFEKTAKGYRHKGSARLPHNIVGSCYNPDSGGGAPLEFQATDLSAVYRFRAQQRADGQVPGIEDVQRVRDLAQEDTLYRWDEMLGNEPYGLITVGVIHPRLGQ